jgi:hypothetical protein
MLYVSHTHFIEYLSYKNVSNCFQFFSNFLPVCFTCRILRRGRCVQYYTHTQAGNVCSTTGHILRMTLKH